MSAEKKRSIFVLGYGNPGRLDDGLGPKAAERLAALGLECVTVEIAYQLNIEDAFGISGHDVVIFVDASLNAPEPFSFEPLTPADEVTFTSHSVSPGSIMKLCADHFGPAPQAWVMAIKGYSFEFEEGLTEQAQKNLDEALTFLSDFLSKQSHESPPEDLRPRLEPMSLK